MYIVYEHLQTNTNMNPVRDHIQLYIHVRDHVHCTCTQILYVLKYYCAQLCSVHVHCTVHQNKKKPTMYLYSKKY